MLLIFIITLIISIIIALLINYFFKNYIFNRKFSLQDGMTLLIKLLKYHSINTVFLLENINPNDQTIGHIKYSLKKKGLNYFYINSVQNFIDCYRVYNKIFNNKFIILTRNIDVRILNEYFYYFKENIIIFNITSNTESTLGKNINTCNSLVEIIRNSFANSTDLEIIGIPEFILYNELNYAYQLNLIKKKQKFEIKCQETNKILIPKEYFLIKDTYIYLNLKSNLEYIYIWKKNSFFDKFKKIFQINRIFVGINDSYDYYPIEHKYKSFIDDKKLNNFINSVSNLSLVISNDVVITQDLASIIHDLAIIFKIDVLYNKFEKDYVDIEDKNINFLILDMCFVNLNYENVYQINHLNYKDIFNYIYSKTFEVNINYMDYDKFSLHNKYRNDLLLLNFNKISKDYIKLLKLDNLYWIENIKLIQINIINYLKLIHLCYPKVCLHLVLDIYEYNNKKIFLLLKKIGIKFIAYINRPMKSKEYISDYGFNILNIQMNQLSFYHNKMIINQSKNSLIIFLQ